jgi:hypothetical protein
MNGARFMQASGFQIAARPDLAAHTHANRASFPVVVGELRQLLGARLVPAALA